MAIIIPSKNIYGQIDNPKVIDNLVDNVTVSQTVITPDNEYDVSVFNINQASASQGSAKIKIERDWRAITGGGAYYSAVAYAKLTDLYDTIDLDIPILQTDKYVSKLLLGDNDDGYPNIKYRLIGDVEKGTCTAYIDVDDAISELTHTPTYSKTEVEFDIPELKATATGTTTIGAPAVTVTSELIVPSESNISSITADDSDGVVFKIRSLKLLTGMTKYEMGGGSSLESGGSTNPNYSGTITGTYEKYTPRIFEVTFYGNKIGISLEDGTIRYGSGTKPYSLSGNELMQNGVPIARRLADRVLEQYGNGKETATIMCGIADYYNQDTFVKATQVNNYFQLSEYGSRNAVSVTDQNTHIALTETDNSLKATQENGVLRLKYSGVDKAISVTDSYENLFGDVRVLPLPGGVVQNDNSFYIATNYDDPIENAVPDFYYDEKTKRYYINISKSSTKYIVYVGLDVYTLGGYEHNYSIDLDLSGLPDGDYNVSYIYDVINNTFHFRDFIVCEGSEVPRNYPMIFKIADVVVPMIRSPYGADIPLSDNADGSPKMFTVASRNITYDGAILQKLSIQEKTITQ